VQAVPLAGALGFGLDFIDSGFWLGHVRKTEPSEFKPEPSWRQSKHEYVD